MQVRAQSVSALDVEADALVILAFDDGLNEVSAKVDQAMDGALSRLIAEGEISTKLGRSYSMFSPAGIKATSLLVVGGGTRAKMTVAEGLKAAGAASKRLADRARHTIAYALDLDARLTESAVCGAVNGCVGQDLLRKDKNFHAPQELVFITDHASSVSRGEKLGKSMLLVRELVNLPPNLLTPTTFTQRALEECAQRNISVEVWDEVRLRKEGCGSLLGVAAGSQSPPRLLIMRYGVSSSQANAKDTGSSHTDSRQPVALVGKGVTFDSGGLSIKPTDGMLTMKCDMAGAATVLGTLCAAADLGIDRPIVGLVGLVENMISGNAFKLGDVLTSRAGTTIEVHNTDAEGRLVLADVLDVALESDPECIIDLATLTGACVVALGVDIAGLMTNDEPLQTRFREAAERAGELVWPLPMHSFFDDQINSQVADIKNMGDGRWGGAITAAKFLQRFVGIYPGYTSTLPVRHFRINPRCIRMRVPRPSCYDR